MNAIIGSKPKNLFFYGATGVGKTFLSNCVAHELLEKGYSVIYFTAFQLFDILSKGVFERDADAIAAHQNIFDCDLLIIDDLGAEATNQQMTAFLFELLNDRILTGIFRCRCEPVRTQAWQSVLLEKLAVPVMIYDINQFFSSRFCLQRKISVGGLAGICFISSVQDFQH